MATTLNITVNSEEWTEIIPDGANLSIYPKSYGGLLISIGDAEPTNDMDAIPVATADLGSPRSISYGSLTGVERIFVKASRESSAGFNLVYMTY